MKKQEENSKASSKDPKKRRKYRKPTLRTGMLFQQGLFECGKSGGECGEDNKS
ncbi:MAG: hypothetical protein RDV41_06565 [Planctomycetota bacterium]|nr:hypothetical protein [Planctomycetota bacterium]